MKLTDIIKEIIKIKMYPGNQGVDIDMDKSDSAEYKSYPKKEIAIQDLVLNEPASKMKSDESVENLKGLVKLLKSGKKLDPILVREVGSKYQILDGHHRYFANKIVGNKSITSIVIPEQDIESLEELRTRDKPILGKGMEHDVYPSNDPTKVIKVGQAKYVAKWVPLFKKHPDLFPIVYKEGLTKNPKVAYVVLEKLDTRNFLEDYLKLGLILSKIKFNGGVYTAIKNSRYNEVRYDEIINKINEINPNMSEFFIKLVDNVTAVDKLMSWHKGFDFHEGQFGYDKDKNIKCLDV